MKVVAMLALMLALIGCSTTPSKLERIEALEVSSASQQTQINQNTGAIQLNTQSIIDTNMRIDRMFKKAMMK